VNWIGVTQERGDVWDLVNNTPFHRGRAISYVRTVLH